MKTWLEIIDSTTLVLLVYSVQRARILITLKKKKKYLHVTESITSAYWETGLIEFFASHRYLAVLSEILATNEYVLSDTFSVVLKRVKHNYCIAVESHKKTILVGGTPHNYVGQEDYSYTAISRCREKKTRPPIYTPPFNCF